MKRAFSAMLAVVGFMLATLALAPAAGASTTTSLHWCSAHHPNYVEDVFEPSYTAGCTGHDEPELDPISNVPGSARNLTWTIVLPTDGAFPVVSTGFGFWTGGTVNDASSLFGQAFQELQFYPDTIATRCHPDGGVTERYVPNAYTICSPVWSIKQDAHGNFIEPAVFNGILGRPGHPMVMHGGDTVTVHYYMAGRSDGWHITVHDVTSGKSGTIVLNSPTDGPLQPSYGRQQIGKSLGWGAVHDTPNSFVWEIGHRSELALQPFALCLPGQARCWSYDTQAWADTTPVRIVSVTFRNGAQPTHWAVVSDFGGKAEVKESCHHYGGRFCIYPWYSSSTGGSWHFGVHYPDTISDYGRANQYAQATHCGGPFGKNSTYCANVIR